MASATACGWTARIPIELYSRTRGAGFGPEVKRRIILGTYVLSSGYYDAYYLRAQKVRTLIRQDFLKAFEKVDALLTPTSPTAGVQARRKDRGPAPDVSHGHLHHFGQPRGHLRDERPVRVYHARPGCRSGCNYWENPSGKPRFCGWRTLMSAPPGGAGTSRRLSGCGEKRRAGAACLRAALIAALNGSCGGRLQGLLERLDKLLERGR